MCMNVLAACMYVNYVYADIPRSLEEDVRSPGIGV